MLHFAYGLNMDVNSMRARCPGSRLVGLGRLKNYAVKEFDPGYLSIVKSGSSVVTGLLWLLNPEDELRLDEFECVELGLYKKRVLKLKEFILGSDQVLIYILRR